MDPNLQHALSTKYAAGAYVLSLPSGAWAVFNLRRQLVGIYNSPGETLDTVARLSIIIPEPPRATPARFTLEDLGL